MTQTGGRLLPALKHAPAAPTQNPTLALGRGTGAQFRLPRFSETFISFITTSRLLGRASSLAHPAVQLGFLRDVKRDISDAP